MWGKPTAESRRYVLGRIVLNRFFAVDLALGVLELEVDAVMLGGLGDLAGNMILLR